MIENGRANREKRFQKLYDTVFNGMESTGILAEIDHKLELANAARDKRKEDLYQEWKEQVYDHIHTQLQDAIDGLSIEEISKKHNEHYNAFLQVATKKSTNNPRGGVFRDVIIQSDYDPLAPHTKFLKVWKHTLSVLVVPKRSSSVTSKLSVRCTFYSRHQSICICCTHQQAIHQSVHVI